MGDKESKTAKGTPIPGAMSQQEIHDTLEDAGIDLSVEDEREKQRDADLKAAHSTNPQGPTTNESETYTRKTDSKESDAKK